MTLAPALASFVSPHVAGVAAPVYRHRLQAFESSSLAQPLRDKTMRFSRDTLARTVEGNNAPNSSTEDADVIFISAWARKYTAKEGARLSGMTPKGFQKLQSGENTISYKRLRQWMRNDIAFAIAHAVECGLILPGQAESAEVLTRAVNAYVRGGA